MAKPRTLLHHAFVAKSHLTGLVKTGVGAMKSVDVALIALSERPRVGDSLDIDKAAKAAAPRERRWDYLLSLPDARLLIGVEPHSAKDDQVRTVIAKKEFTRRYLLEHFHPGWAVSRWIWVTRERVSFSKMERAQRLLQQNGIIFAGRIIRRL